MGNARLFVAVDPPALVREELLAWARGAVAGLGRSEIEQSPRVLRADALHLTLCFLGSRPVAEIESIAAAVSGCALPVGELSVGAPLWLPPRRPRALAVEIHDHEGELTALHEAVVGALARVGVWEPGRTAGARRAHTGRARGVRFRPHVTVARLRAGCAPGERRLKATPALSFVPDALVLYRSWLSPAGASYEALASSPLA